MLWIREIIEEGVQTKLSGRKERGEQRIDYPPSKSAISRLFIALQISQTTRPKKINKLF